MDKIGKDVINIICKYLDFKTLYHFYRCSKDTVKLFKSNNKIRRQFKLNRSNAALNLAYAIIAYTNHYHKPYSSFTLKIQIYRGTEIILSATTIYTNMDRWEIDQRTRSLHDIIRSIRNCIVDNIRNVKNLTISTSKIDVSWSINIHEIIARCFEYHYCYLRDLEFYTPYPYCKWDNSLLASMLFTLYWNFQQKSLEVRFKPNSICSWPLTGDTKIYVSPPRDGQCLLKTFEKNGKTRYALNENGTFKLI